MALKQEHIAHRRIDENGDTVLQFSLAHAGWIEGLSRTPSTSYAAGDVVICPYHPEYMLECVTAGTTSSAVTIDTATVAKGDTITDGSVKWRVFPTTGGMPVGFEYFQMNPNIPTGSLPLFGGTYSRAAYADLWTWVQTQTGYLITEAEWQEKATANNGNVPFYSDGDGSTTFRVPSLSCWVRGANGEEKVGSYLEAGLPNIEGSWIPIGVSNHEANNPATGAFTNKAGNSVTSWASSSSKRTYGFGFDASKSNPIYGACDTVQPPSIVGMHLVIAFGTVSNVGNQDIADISAGLTRVEEQMTKYTDEVACIDSFVVESWVSNDGLSWYRKYSDGWIEQGGTLLWSAVRAPGEKLITLNTPFATDTYSVNLETLQSAGGTFGTSTWGRTTTQFYGFTYGHGSDDKSQGMMWHAYGY